MEIVKLNEIEYINCDDFFKKAPIYCKDSRNGRELIKNKKIKDFIYVRFKDNKWIITDGKSPKYDKILFTDTFMKTIDELNGSTDIKDDIGIEMALPVPYTQEAEKSNLSLNL